MVILNMLFALLMTVLSAGSALSPCPAQVLANEPLLIHNVDNTLVRPGETATFSLLVTNPGTRSYSDVIIKDTLPAILTLASAGASRGETSISGQAVQFTLGHLAPGETVTMQVSVRAADDLPIPADALNAATLSYTGGLPRTVTAAVRVTEGRLPATGERPLQSYKGILETIALGAVAALAFGFGVYLRYRRAA